MRNDYRREDGCAGQSAHLNHFRKVLVGLTKGILTAAQVEFILDLGIVGYHLFSPARIACQGKSAKMGISANQAGSNKRFHKGDETSRMTTRIRNPLRLGNAIPPPEKFGEPVLPSICNTMGRRCINDHSRGILDKRDGFDCGCVRETQERDIRTVQRILTSRRILARFLGENHKLQIAARRKTLTNPETCRSRRTVNEDPPHFADQSSSVISSLSSGGGVASLVAVPSPSTFLPASADFSAELSPSPRLSFGP